MFLRYVFFFVLVFTMVGCQFSETLVLNADGSGTMRIEADLNEMMALGGSAALDSTIVKLDTVINMKQFMAEKRDSISKLSAEDQMKLKKIENFNMGIKMNSQTSEMVYEISANFKNIAEVNDMFNGLEQAANLMPGNKTEAVKTTKEEGSQELIGVNYSFAKGVFKRDAYIKDKKMHQQQVDSLEQAAAFMEGSYYTLKYTFPKKVKNTSNPAATFSADKKTVTVQTPFFEYFRNPDLLDLQVELEK